MFKILFLCSKNAGRSRIAQAFARQLASEDIEIECAGDKKLPINPIAVEVMEEFGLQIEPMVSNSYEDVESQQFDAVITLCSEAREKCPDFPGSPAKVHWNLPDPMEYQHDLVKQREVFITVRDEIQSRVEVLFKYGYINSMLELRSTFNLLLNNMTDGVMAHDNNRRIFFYNRSAEEITGYKYSEVIGQSCRYSFEGQFCGESCRFCDNVNEDMESNCYPMKFKRKDGEELDIDLSVSKIISPTLKENGTLIIFKDVTEITLLKEKLKHTKDFEGIVGRHSTMLKVFESIKNLSDVNVPILIQGESGTGKEMVANALHKRSSRADKPLIAVNCGALPEGLLESELFGHMKGSFTGAIKDKRGRFELADQGTIFLDEISDLSPATQVKLLRVLQEMTFVPVGGEKEIKVDVRVICATNTNLLSLVRKGKFREDLYYRLAVVPVNIPPLRDRRDDIPLLIYHFIDKLSSDMKFDSVSVNPEAIELLTEYRWHGNVRELINVIQYSLIHSQGKTIGIEHLPPEVNHNKNYKHTSSPGRPSKTTYDEALSVLEKVKGNQSLAAKELGISRSTLYRLLKKH